MPSDRKKPLPGSADPQYPVGRFARPEAVDRASLQHALFELGELPQNLRQAVRHLDAGQLDTPYRADGWTVRQVVHHVADSHMNAYVRMKLALTEEAPTIKLYEEKLWAGLHDGADAPVDWSLNLVEGLHARWLMLLRSLKQAGWQRVYVHPEMGAVPLDVATVLYGWHSRHHVAHITTLRAARRW